MASPFETIDKDLSDHEFDIVRGLLHRIAGIHLTDAKRDLVRVRLGKRLRALGWTSFEEYVAHIQSAEGQAELARMVDGLTTNKTSFFREPAHFTFLREVVFPAWSEDRRAIRIWSAGCSTGEEPYSLAMLLLESLPRIAERDVRILATDISPRVLKVARAGRYGDEEVVDVPDLLRARYFLRHENPRGGSTWEVRPEVRALVRFAHLNLMDDWPMRGPFDAIFCRNVMIYFDHDTRQRLVQRFEGLLDEGGYLFVGHSESLSTYRQGLEYIQPAVYRR